MSRSHAKRNKRSKNQRLKKHKRQLRSSSILPKDPVRDTHTDTTTVIMVYNSDDTLRHSPFSTIVVHPDRKNHSLLAKG